MMERRWYREGYFLLAACFICTSGTLFAAIMADAPELAVVTAIFAFIAGMVVATLADAGWKP